mgnify:CR=1 FL=1
MNERKDGDGMTDAMSMTWSDRIGPRGRRPWLLLSNGDMLSPFEGRSIPGVLVVVGTDYYKDGKWSHTEYRLRLASGVRHIAGRDGWETGDFAEGLGAATDRRALDTWPAVAEALGVSVPGAMEFLRAWRPKAAEKLDGVDRALEALEAADESREADPVMVVVRFGSPTNRAIREGYWTASKPVPGYDGAEICLRDPAQGWWAVSNIAVAGIRGAVLSVKHSAGMHGGHFAVSVAVLPSEPD